MDPRYSDRVDPTRPDDNDGALVGGDADCDHPTAARDYLGQMGVAAFYRCAACEGAIIVW